MKKFLSILPLLWILLLSWCGKSVVEYNDSLVSIVKECTDANKTLFDTFQTDWVEIDAILESLQANIDMCNDARQDAIDLWNYKGDSSLKNAVVELMALEVDYLEKFRETKRYRNKDDITEEDKEAYGSLVSQSNDAQNLLNQQFVALQEIQEEFAAKYGLNLKS